MSSCGSSLYRDLRFLNLLGPKVTGRNAWVLSDRVRQGYYWWILQASGFTTDAGLIPLALHLVPPGQGPVTQTDADDPFFGVTNLPPSKASVRIDRATKSTENISQSSQMIDLNDGPIILPENWALMGWEEKPAAPGVSLHQMCLRIAYLELTFDQEPPTLF